jgi:hypothetical protein
MRKRVMYFDEATNETGVRILKIIIFMKLTISISQYVIVKNFAE